MPAPLRVAQVGLGPIGRATARLLADAPWASLAGGVDASPALAGRPLAEVCELPGDATGTRALPPVAPSFSDLAGASKIDAVLLTTGSRCAETFALARPMLEAGLTVVTSCEELLFPAHREPALTAEIDALCRRTGARMLGTGVNPGFVLDLLPVLMSGICARLRRVKGTRIVDAATRRTPLQHKIGCGLDPDTFRERWRDGRAGHAGFQESLRLIVHALNWPVGPIEETCAPVIAQSPLRTVDRCVESGHVRGLHQSVRAQTPDGRSIHLNLTMALAEADPHDAIRLDADPPVHLRIEGGIAGDLATAAALLNALRPLHAAPPGVRLLTDIPPPRCAL